MKDYKSVQEKVLAVFPDCEVSVDVRNGNITVEVSRMYEHVELPFSKMMALAEVFGTTEYTVNNWSSGGCETCDYGSKYVHEFTYTEATA